MVPAQLSEDSFQAYPVRGRAVATANLALLRKLPLGFAPFLLREVIVCDWKFPREQRELEAQLAYLNALPEAARVQEMQHFSALQLAPKLAQFDWVNRPAEFLEQLSAHLWATHQMDGFRDASEAYVHKFTASLPVEQPVAPRLGIAVFGESVAANRYKLFRKMRPLGAYYAKVDPAGGLSAIHEHVKARAENHPIPYAHWRIDGGAEPGMTSGVVSVSYAGVAPIREKLAAKMLAAYQSPKFDPERLRSELAATNPETIGMARSADPILDRFQLSLLTEGSGTQVFSTTFVQWAAREALRRAHPITVFTRYAPRQKDRTMDELLAGGHGAASVDPRGSLIDGDMSAYYTLLNMQRLPGAEDLRFLAWFEGHGEALAIGPGMKPGSEDTSAVKLDDLLKKLT